MAKSETRTLPKFLKTMLAVLLIVAASIGATLYYSSQNGKLPFTSAAAEPDADAAPEAPRQPPKESSTSVPPPIFVALEPFTVTLRNERSNRILHVAITLRVADEASRQLLGEYMPEVRDRILRKLSEQHPILVQTGDGRTQLVQDLVSTLEAPYHPRLKAPIIDNVLFTAFVVQ